MWLSHLSFKRRVSSSWQNPCRESLKPLWSISRLFPNGQVPIREHCSARYDSPPIWQHPNWFINGSESTDHVLGRHGILKLLQKFLNLCSQFLLQTSVCRPAQGQVLPFKGTWKLVRNAVCQCSPPLNFNLHFNKIPRWILCVLVWGPALEETKTQYQVGLILQPSHFHLPVSFSPGKGLRFLRCNGPRPLPVYKTTFPHYWENVF